MIEGANLAAYRHGLRIGVVVSIEGGSEEVGKAVCHASGSIQSVGCE